MSVNTGSWWAKAFYASGRTGVPQGRWLHMKVEMENNRRGRDEYVSLFRIHSFSEADSESITQGLSDAASFILTNTGNVRCFNNNEERFEYLNPLDLNSVKDFDASASLDDMRGDQFKFDDKRVASANMRFFLLKGGKGFSESLWHL